MRRLIDDKVLVHIGLPKTGTTWLQVHLFEDARHGFFAPSPEETAPKQKVKAIAYRLYRDGAGRLINEEDFDAEALRRELAHIEVPEGRQTVISNERLCGNPFSNGFDRSMICRRIRAVFPNARILLVIREQRAMILSNYRQYLNYGGWHAIERYLDPPSDARQPALSPSFWKYDKLIGLYQEAFGTENLLVLPYEMFVRSPKDFVSELCRFVGLPPPHDMPWAKKENTRQGYVALYYLRRLTRINRRTSANAYFPSMIPQEAGKVIDRGLKIALQAVIPKSLEENLRAQLQRRVDAILGPAYFRESNRRTQELIGLELGGYGYEL